MIFRTAFPRVCFGVFWLGCLLAVLYLSWGRVLFFLRRRKEFVSTFSIPSLVFSRSLVRARIEKVVGDLVLAYFQAQDADEKESLYSQYLQAVSLAESFGYPLPAWPVWQQWFEQAGIIGNSF